jgi:hypothetical protein
VLADSAGLKAAIGLLHEAPSKRRRDPAQTSLAESTGTVYDWHGV